MASVNIDKIIHLERFQDGVRFLPLVFYVPLGIALAVVRSFIFLHALFIFYFLAKIPFVCNVVLRVMLAICGLVVTTEGAVQVNQKPLVLVANHVTSLDPFILRLVTKYVLMMEPCLKGDFSLMCQQVSVPANKSKEDMLQLVKKTLQDAKLPLLLFPEGGRANSCLGLLKFRTWPFQLEAPIQPIGIFPKRCCFNLNISTVESLWWVDLLVTFFVPFTIYKIKYLPLSEQRESESAEQFSERVQANLAKGLGTTATQFNMSDVTEFVKNRQRESPSVSETEHQSATNNGSVTMCKSAASTGESLASAQAVSADPALNVMVKQVMDVLPNLNSYAILQDLERTRDVDSTITNILEGRVDIQQLTQPSPPPAADAQAHTSTFKAVSFPRSANERQMSLQERKEAMLDAARKLYKEKHGIP